MAAGTQFPTNLGYLLCKEEVTYKTDPIPDESDFLYVEDITGDIKTNTEQRTGLSPHAKGWKSVSTNKTAALSGTCEVVPVTITDATDLPQSHPLLVACGLAHTSDVGGDPKRQIYTMQAVGTGSCTFYKAMLNTLKDKGILQKFTGFRGTLTIDITAKERWKFTWTGEAAPVDLPMTIDAGTTPPIYTDIINVEGGPLVGTGAKLSIFDTVGGVVFGGGTEASPLCEAFVTSMKINLNMGVTRRDGINCADGNGGRVDLRPGDEYATIETEMEVVALDEFNFWAIQEEKRPVKIVIEQPAAAAGVDGVRFTCVTDLGDFDPIGDSDGTSSVTANWSLIYGDDGSGNYGNKPDNLGVFEFFSYA